MKLPEKFKFTHSDTTQQYTAHINGDICSVYWTDCDGPETINYPTADAAEYVKQSIWVIQAESFPQLVSVSSSLQVLISEKKDASQLSYQELKALRLTRGLINRLLDDCQ